MIMYIGYNSVLRSGSGCLFEPEIAVRILRTSPPESEAQTMHASAGDQMEMHMIAQCRSLRLAKRRGWG